MIEAFVDPAFADLDDDDTAVWNSAVAGRRSVTVGTDGFATMALAIAAVDAGGTIWLSADLHESPTTITKSVTIRGMDSQIGLVASLTPTPDEGYVLAPVTVSAATVRFRDVEFLVDGDAPALLLKATSGGLLGVTHCTFTGPATIAARADGAGAGVVLCGCEYASITTNASTDGGAAAVFAATTTPVGGSSGRRGNHYRHKLLIEAPAVLRGAARSQEITWVPVDECYGSIEPLRAGELLEAKLAAANATHRIEFPGGLTVTPAFRVTWRERQYELSASLSTDARENRLSFMASERQM